MTIEEKRQKRNAYMREYYRTHPEYRKYVSACSLKSYHKNQDKYNERCRQYRRKNPEKSLERVRKWRQNNRDRANQWAREWRNKNREILRERYKRYKEAEIARNPEKVAEMYRKSARRYRLRHPDKCRKATAEWGKRNPEKRLEYVHRRRARRLGGSVNNTAPAFYMFVRSKKKIPCYYCGKIISGKSAHVDHVIALAKSGNHSSENLCASCPPCNQSKHDKSLSEWAPKNNQPVLNL